MVEFSAKSDTLIYDKINAPAGCRLITGERLAYNMIYLCCAIEHIAEEVFMSRLDDAILAIEQAVTALAGAVDSRAKAQAEAPSAIEVSEADLQAMKSELHEAMQLLQSVKAPSSPQDPSSQQDEVSS
ncbi:MAG: hypothetical protein ACON49_07415 [Candidatus Puniceispirillaceae bacterium]